MTGNTISVSLCLLLEEADGYNNLHYMATFAYCGLLLLIILLNLLYIYIHIQRLTFMGT